MLKSEHADVHVLSCPMDAQIAISKSRAVAITTVTRHARSACDAAVHSLTIACWGLHMCCISDIRRLPGMAYLLHGSLSLFIGVLPGLL